MGEVGGAAKAPPAPEAERGGRRDGCGRVSATTLVMSKPETTGATSPQKRKGLGQMNMFDMLSFRQLQPMAAEQRAERGEAMPFLRDEQGRLIRKDGTLV